MQSEYREKNVERIRRQLKISELGYPARPRGLGVQISSELAFPVTANAGMVSDEELEQMLDSGQSEVFVSNVSGPGQHPSVGLPSLSPGFFVWRADQGPDGE